MNQAERDRLDILKKIQAGILTFTQGAELLDISERQLYRSMAEYQKDGDSAVVHGLRGRPSNHGYSDQIKNEIIALHKALYDDYGPTLFAQMLLEHHHYDIDHETIRRWFHQAAYAIPSARKARKHRHKRARRSAIGELIQFDGSPHDWFEGRGPNCCLLHAIDDASNQTFLQFAPSENAADAMRTLWRYMERYGIPRALYTDHGGVFYAEKKLTDLGRAMKELGVEMIFANSPQAKGRVERGNRTHQDRLVKAMRRENISTIGQANQFLEQRYLADHNQAYALTEGLPDIHRPVLGRDLKNIFCFQTIRQVHNDYTITLDATYVQLERSEEPLPPPKQYVTVRRYLDQSLHIFWNERELRSTVLTNKPKPPKTQRPRTPAPNHPWRRRHTLGHSRNQRSV